MNIDSLFKDPAFALHYEDMVRCLTGRKRDETRAKVYLGLMIERAGVKVQENVYVEAVPKDKQAESATNDGPSPMEQVISDLNKIAPALNAGASKSYVLPDGVSAAHIMGEIAMGALRIPVPMIMAVDGQQVLSWGEMPGMEGAVVVGG